MSDIEEQCLQTAPSTCSEVDQDTTPAVHSISSIDFVQQQGHSHKTTMSGSSGYKSFLPGHQRPPHHHFGHGSQEEHGKPPPVPPLKRESSTHQWSFDMSESVSGDTGSPRKEKSDVPVFSLVSRQAGGGDSVQRSTAEEDPVDEGDRTPLEKPQKTHSKRKKSRRSKKSENLAMQDVTLAQTRSPMTEPVEYAPTSMAPVRESKTRSQKNRAEAASSIQSTGTYTVEGEENPAFDGAETMDSVTRKKGDVQQSLAPTSSRDTVGTAVSVSEAEVGDSNHVGGHNRRPSLDSQFPKYRSVHGVTLNSGAMSSETRRLINQVSMIIIIMIMNCIPMTSSWNTPI